MEQYTILQAAQAAGITKNTAKSRLKKAPKGATHMGPDGKTYISSAGFNWLMQSIKENPPKPVSNQKTEPPVLQNSVEPPVLGSTTTQEPPKPPHGKTTGSTKAVRTTGSEPLIKLLQEINKQQAQELEQKNQEINRLLSQLDATTQALNIAQQTALQAQNTAAAAQALHAGTLQSEMDKNQPSEPEPVTAVQEPEKEPAAPWWKFWK